MLALCLIAVTGAALAEAPSDSSVSLSDLYETFFDDAPAAVDFRLSRLDGAVLRLSDLRGKVVVLHFWATWCAPCKRELPSLRTFYEQNYPKLEPRGMKLITISNDVRREDLERFLDRAPQPFPVYFDSLSELNEQLQIVGLPGTVILGRDGAVLDRAFGERNWQDPLWQERLERALGAEQ